MSMRVPEKLKRAMDESGISWKDEIIKFIERKVKEHRKAVCIQAARRVRGKMMEVDSVRLIREDRDR